MNNELDVNFLRNIKGVLKEMETEIKFTKTEKNNK